MNYLKERQQVIEAGKQIEKSAHITIARQAVGGAVALPQADIDAMRKYFLNSYGQR